MLHNFPCPYRDVCPHGDICDKEGAEVVECREYQEFVLSEKRKIGSILKTLRGG